MTRILYFCPDFPQPSGGTKRLYRHVQTLRQLGWDAYILHQRHGFALTWHGYQAPILWLEDRPEFRRSDVWVFPEVALEWIRQTQNLGDRRVVLALSWAPGYSRLRPGERWQDYGVAQALTPSPVIKRYLEWSTGIRVTLVDEYVDPTRYFPDPAGKLMQIAYLTRKDTSGEWLHGLLTRKQPELNSYAWLPLRGLDEAVYAHHLRTSRLYLVTTMQEGMNVSVLEALSCGCLVVGYAGVGGHAYMVGHGARQNCVLVENGNLPALGEALETVLLQLLADPHAFDWILTNGLTTARAYQDPTGEARSLQTFFAQFT
jgi:hypothetical protein